MFRFNCTSCNQIHEGMPTFAAYAPLSYLKVPEAERGVRVALSTDDCVIDDKYFYVRGCIELHVHGQDEQFVWGVWASLSEKSYKEWVSVFDKRKRSHVGPFFGWLNSWLEPYPYTENLKTYVHLRDNGIRPYIELEPTDHPLAVEQREGITVARVAEIYSLMMHPAL